MKTPIARLWLFVCAVAILFAACQKEVSHNTESTDSEKSQLRTSGTVPDDPGAIAKVPMIVSSEFYNSMNQVVGARGGTSSQKDSDRDGIPDVSDGCPKLKETVNGYQDTDGCPDTAPSTSTDTDGDGIADATDACDTQAETVNGYQDTDGCPDTVPDTDGDGIIDTQDLCPAEAETVNGFEDTDGCPDTPPVVVPPTPLPSSFQLVMPPVGNQGGEFSCVAFAAGYAARSAEYYYQTNASSYDYVSNIFSPEFLYNQTKVGDCGSGASTIRTLEFLKNTGVSTWQSMPYSNTNGCSLLPTSSQLNEAANYKIISYSSVYKSDITAIKNLLVQNHPLIISVVLDQSFPMAGPGFIWKSFSGSGGLGHSLTICGYDDAKHAYKVMNSWGTSWGDAGYSWIDYDFLPQTGDVAAYVINP
ncbi:C1 family peptidase [Terrimonas alba]|uniref:C1 family peptidase n=1 Tax=Terrimonas alba TaxID=3349636 RepID=UPI0035F29D6E